MRENGRERGAQGPGRPPGTNCPSPFAAGAMLERDAAPPGCAVAAYDPVMQKTTRFREEIRTTSRYRADKMLSAEAGNAAAAVTSRRSRESARRGR